MIQELSSLNRGGTKENGEREVNRKEHEQMEREESRQKAVRIHLSF